ncbi:AAA-domain-containing protein [Pseudovirgaria hyperparasitica]|uniref:AAA-domain-containing protein n=1 Tax=Pseudovirgaria hyperparasitica TaxID=470096 RepID=A0A6A6WIZ1_9PEZI|nr:AAA-domain-containing protein [Pseudovirgaria hyperparasitica]KAF2762070.1 AAA-domain-containing protein [Pseudovirgaria hyperparasitica]
MTWGRPAAARDNSHEKRLKGGIINPDDIHTTFQDVHVSPDTIDTLKMLTGLSLLRPEAFTYGVLARSKIPGLLLYGPPGTGKTLLAKAVAKDTRATVLEVSGADLNDKYVGEGEKNVKAVFSLARKLASRQGGCVIFIDEADAILSSRSSETSSRGHRETINQFLKEWDGMNEQGVFIMVATNRPFDLDDAVLRRLPRRILVDLPVKDDRKKILQIHLRDESLDESISLTALAEETRLFSGSDLKNLCVSAALACVKEEYESDLAKDVTSTFPAAANISSERRVLHRRHFDKALQEIGSSVSEDMGSLAAIRKFDERFGDKMARGKKKSRWGFGQVDAESEAAASERAARVRS